MQDNRYTKDNPALDKVDHALGRPFDPFNTTRSHFATDCPIEILAMSVSDWWSEAREKFGMTYFNVSDVGREALAAELADKSKYGRLFSITSKSYDGEKLIFAKSHSQAKYRAWIDADIDWSFMDYCKEIRVRLAA